MSDPSYRDSLDLDPLSPSGVQGEAPDAESGIKSIEDLVSPSEKPLPPLFHVVPEEPEFAALPEVGRYKHFTDTVRLYAGWLLAWYFLIYAFGSYQFTGSFPYTWTLLADLFLSPVILTFAFGAFLFLLCTSLHRAIGRGILSGFILVGLWIVSVLLFRANI